MFAALVLSFLAAGPVLADPPHDDPPIELWINNDGRFLPGETVEVHVRTDQDGYLLVVHADPDGRVRVLFPLDPGDDNLVRGGKRYEIRGRGDRATFEASITGRGMVYAAVSRDPFRFDQYTLDGHWDYGALAPNRLPREPETELTQLVRNLAQTSFDYDVLTYDVIERVYGSTYYSEPAYRHWHAGALCDPFYYNNFYCGSHYPYYGSFFSVRLVFGQPYHRYYYDPFFYRPVYLYPYRPAYVYPYSYPYSYPRRYYTYGSYRSPDRYYAGFPRGRSGFGDYRDRQYTFRQADNRPSSLAPGRRTLTAPAVGATPERRTAGTRERVEPRTVRPMVERRPVGRRTLETPSVGRPAVEARRVRPVERQPDVESRPMVESRPVRREPEARRVEPETRRVEPEARYVEPEARRVEPEARSVDRGRADASPRRAEPERSRPAPRGEADNGGARDRGGERRTVSQPSRSSPSRSEGRSGGGGGGRR